MAEQDSTYEEATRCPKCGKPGNVRSQRKAPNVRGAMLHIVYCENPLCRWDQQCWMVQVNADGSVPPPSDHRNEPKVYVGFENHDELARRIIASLEAQLETETSGNGEIRNPNSH